MIILCVSLSEARDLIAGRPDRALQMYLQQEAKMESLLPDDNLPNAILLRGVELDADKRNYVVTYRTYASFFEAEEAWRQHADEETEKVRIA